MSLVTKLLRSVPLLVGTVVLMNACMEAPAPTALRGDDQTEAKPKKKAPPKKDIPADDDDDESPSGGSTGGNPTPAPPAEGAPTLSAVDPSAVTVGSQPQGIRIKLTGTRFTTGSEVDLAGNKLPATLRSPTELEVQVPGNLLASTGVLRLSVVVPQKGESNALTFTVANPTSVVINALQPVSAIVGGNTVNLTVRGSGFISTSAVRFNGAALPTTFRSSGELSASIPSSALTQPGRVDVTVSSGNDVVSLPSSFEIRNPQPQVTNLSPRSVASGSGAIAVTIDGNGFSPSSAVLAGNAPLATTFLSAQRLRVTLPSSLLTRAGTLRFTVTNAAPGGGTAAAPTFTITQATTTCRYTCAEYGYAANECYEGWTCDGATGCLYEDVCGAGGGGGGGGGGANASCVYKCSDYGYASGQCYSGWYCIPNGEYAGCLGQTTC